jgi:hypothetical protein
LTPAPLRVDNLAVVQIMAHYILEGMGASMKDLNITPAMHRQIAAKVREQLDAALAQVRELEAVERFHLIQAGEQFPPTNGRAGAVASKAAKVPANTTWHDAAVIALKGLGEPAKIGQIADYLELQGFGAKLTRRRVYNAIYVALTRRKDLFEPLGGSKWKLKTQAVREEG